jgi:tetratricopeptide (TPR) repeat protein
MLMRVGTYKLSNMPLGHPLREALLQDALQFYESLLPQSNDAPSLREDIASVLHNMGLIQRELGRFDDAIRSYQRSIEYLQPVVDHDPQPPRLQEKLAAYHEALAFTWSINRTAAGRHEADRQFRNTLELFQQIERDWPDRPQPVGLCLRQLAKSAFERGDLKDAETYWRQAMDRGEAYVNRHPHDIDARSGLCWARGEICDAILLPSQERAAEAEPILKKAYEHSSIMLKQSPKSAQARDVRAFLSFSLARCYCRTERADQAIEAFQQALNEIESLCAEFPWTQQHWDTNNYFQRDTVRELERAKQPDAAADALTKMVKWLKTIAPQLPADTVAQDELRRCRTDLVELLRSTGREQEAQELKSRRLEKVRGN